MSSVVSRYLGFKSWYVEPANWIVLVALMVLVGSRHMWSIWYWEFSEYAISFSDAGAVFPAVIAVLLIRHSTDIRNLFKRLFSHSRFLIIAIAAFWLWIVLRGATSGDLSNFISVSAQSLKSMAILVLLVALIGKVGSQKTLNAFFVVGIITVFVSMIPYVHGVIKILSTLGSDGHFLDKDLWYPRFGYEASYAKVLQYEGLAQDPNVIAVVYASAIFGGLAALFNNRRGALAVLLGLAVIEMAVILTLSRSTGVTIAAVLIFLVVNAVWRRNNIARILLGRIVGAGVICVGMLAIIFAVIQVTPISQRYGFSIDDAISMVSIKSTGNVSYRISYQQEAVSDSFRDVPTALFGHGAKANPEGIKQIENMYVWILYQYGLIELLIAGAIAIAVLVKMRQFDKSRAVAMVLIPFALWLGVVSAVAVILYGVSLWALVALVLIETDVRESAITADQQQSMPA